MAGGGLVTVTFTLSALYGVFIVTCNAKVYIPSLLGALNVASDVFEPLMGVIFCGPFACIHLNPSFALGSIDLLALPLSVTV